MAKSNQKTIILGGSGFIGSECSKLITNNGMNVVSLDSKICDLLEEKKSIKFLNKILNKNDKLIFISAIAPCKDFDSFHKNIKMLNPILNSKIKNKISKLVYISSDAVYSDSKKKISENSKTEPENLHGLMHLIREKLLLNLYEEKISIIRPTLVYGKHDTHNGYGPNKFSRLALLNKKIEIFGNGEEIRDHVNISDVANLIFLALISKKNNIYNAVSCKPITFLKIAKLIVNKFKSKSKIIKLKRKTKMPHGGYRCFSMKNTKKDFKNFKTKSLENSLDDLKNIRFI